MGADPSEHDDATVREWKAEQLTRLGLPDAVAALFVDYVDWHQVDDLVRRGCPLGLALEIVS